MKWIPDPTKRFPKRPYFTTSEIDLECERILSDYFNATNGGLWRIPLLTDDLTKIIEVLVDDLDLYSDLAKSEGEGIEGLTEFYPGKKPIVKIDISLSGSNRENRLRSTLAHELFHVKFHQSLWQLLWSGKRSKIPRGAICHRDTILNAKNTDWFEWQAAYGSGAVLMTQRTLKDFLRPLGLSYREPLLRGSTKAVEIVNLVAQRFQVSTEAADVRLNQVGFLRKS